jgi:rare lipoprotein A
VLPFFLLLLLLPACGRNPRVSGPPSAPVSGEAAEIPGRPPLEANSFLEEGQASWYGDPYHGRPAASGEIFDKNKLTAAHRTLAFDTWVRVENQANGRTVDVRINDRGPFVAGRIIDLSEAAAREIDMVRAGIAPVRVSILQIPPEAGVREVDGDGLHAVRLGAGATGRESR